MLNHLAGTRGKLIQWLDYLDGGEQRMHVRGAFFRLDKMTGGVP